MADKSIDHGKLLPICKHLLSSQFFDNLCLALFLTFLVSGMFLIINFPKTLSKISY